MNTFVDTRPRAQWDAWSTVEHTNRCEALATAGRVLRRTNGIEVVEPDLRMHREQPLKTELPDASYLVLFRRENESDVGFCRALGPGGWEGNFPTWTMAQRACFDHYNSLIPDEEEPSMTDGLEYTR